VDGQGRRGRRQEGGQGQGRRPRLPQRAFRVRVIDRGDPRFGRHPMSGHLHHQVSVAV